MPGLSIATLNHTSLPEENDQPNKYLYNGKELQNENGLGWYDYGARYYDPRVGRWWSVDPLAEKYTDYSAYVYTMANPVRFYDVMGMAAADELWKQLSENTQAEYVGSEEWKEEQKKKEEENKKQNAINEILKKKGGEHNRTQNKSKGSFPKITFNGKITAGVQTGGLFGLGGRFGVFVNLFSITLIGYDSKTKKVTYPGSQKFNYSQMNQSISGGYIIGAEVSHTFDGGIESGGYSNSKTTMSINASGKMGISVIL